MKLTGCGFTAPFWKRAGAYARRADIFSEGKEILEQEERLFK
jgi:hypothetical protein